MSEEKNIIEKALLVAEGMYIFFIPSTSCRSTQVSFSSTM